jgi:pimeloyl-ACP methyl ester carboxylesterase
VSRAEDHGTNRARRPPVPPAPGAGPAAARRGAPRDPSTLLLLAGRSTLLHADRALARVTALIPGVQAEIVPDVGHALTLEAPDLVNARILRFISEARVQSG